MFCCNACVVEERKPFWERLIHGYGRIREAVLEVPSTIEHTGDGSELDKNSIVPAIITLLIIVLMAFLVNRSEDLGQVLLYCLINFVAILSCAVYYLRNEMLSLFSFL